MGSPFGVSRRMASGSGSTSDAVSTRSGEPATGCSGETTSPVDSSPLVGHEPASSGAGGGRGGGGAGAGGGGGGSSPARLDADAAAASSDSCAVPTPAGA